MTIQTIKIRPARGSESRFVGARNLGDILHSNAEAESVLKTLGFRGVTNR